jgi:tRNA threonylcarbamoyladenosine biosynthesis protein TsaB
VGQVGLALGDRLLQCRQLDETRRHARDLAPAVADLLAAQNWQPHDVQGVIVSRGPGSYTGLRVGIMSAKVFVYVTGAALVAVDTFAAIAEQVGAEVSQLDVLADAQQDRVYLQRFARESAAASLLPISPLTIQPVSTWLATRGEGAWVSGPGLRQHEKKLAPGIPVVAPDLWDPQPTSLLRIGLAQYQSGRRNDPWTLEPLYLRPSAAEEKWQARTAQS